MKKLAKTLAVVLLLVLATTSLFAANGNETAVLRLTAYISEKTTFNTSDDEFIVASNAHNFSYSVQQWAGTKMLFVVAN
ncbi:MAG: hypothetical protein EOM68_01555 [Spirochaetia bacterium]|nr:hypothetical protein [Spirochaetia bacterium]